MEINIMKHIDDLEERIKKLREEINIQVFEMELKALAKAGEIDFPISDKFVEEEIKDPAMICSSCGHNKWINRRCENCGEHWKGD